jgi:hypothetical protein
MDAGVPDPIAPRVLPRRAPSTRVRPQLAVAMTTLLVGGRLSETAGIAVTAAAKVVAPGATLAVEATAADVALPAA